MPKGDVALFKEERIIQIFNLLETDHRVEVSDLSSRFGVSEDTIRRDLRELESRGVALKTHGGALRKLATPRSFENRLEYATHLKSIIGSAAANLVEDGDCLLIDSGTTALSLAHSLAVEHAKILTNSLEVARIIAERPNLELIVLGGKWDPLHQLVGPSTIDQLSQYRVDKLFLGMAGLDAQHGITAPSEQEASVKRAMLNIAKQVIGLADHTKLGEVTFAYVAPAARLNVLVTDDKADLGSFAGLDWKVIRVSGEEIDEATR